MEAITLSQLTDLIKETINISLDQYYYVVAEINQININRSGHAYLQLVEKSKDNNTTQASIRAVIWANKYRIISDYFTSVTGAPLSNGMKILVKAEVSFHNIYGLSLIIHDIDATYTMGEMERKRQEIINKLEADGIMDMNKNLEFPIVPQRIAIISSPTAAGLGDFLDHLLNNPYGYAFSYKLFEAVMQGEKTEKTIIAALDKIYENYTNFDIVAIIRGGGSKLDLSAFDSYNIATNIAQFPLPVITGIGHQRDLSIADMVAYRSLKTPTATADFIVNKVALFDTTITEKYNYLKEIAFSFINKQDIKIQTLQKQLQTSIHLTFNTKEKQIALLQERLKQNTKLFFTTKYEKLTSLNKQLILSTENFIDSENNKISQKINTLKKHINYFLTNSELKLNLLEEKIKSADPRKILNMGFTITTVNGKRAKSVDAIKPGDIIKTYFKDGKIKSKVIK